MPISKIRRWELKDENAIHLSMVDAKKSRLRPLKRDFQRGDGFGRSGYLAAVGAPVGFPNRGFGAKPIVGVLPVPLIQAVGPRHPWCRSHKCGDSFRFRGYSAPLPWPLIPGWGSAGPLVMKGRDEVLIRHRIWIRNLQFHSLGVSEDFLTDSVSGCCLN